VADIRCEDYGFDCDYSIEGDVYKVVQGYWHHMNDEHGIEYSTETIYKTIKKKLPKQIPTIELK